MSEENNLINLNPNFENDNNNYNNQFKSFVIKPNVFYEQIFYNRIQFFIDGVNNYSDLNILVSLIEPKNIYNNICNALRDLFNSIYIDNHRNMLNEHIFYLNAIFDELIHNCMDNFEACHNIIMNYIRKTQENQFHKSKETSLTGAFLEGAAVSRAIDKFYKTGKASLSASILSGMATTFYNKKELENQKAIMQMEIDLHTDIRNLLNEQILAEIDNIFARTFLIIPSLCKAIYVNKLFLVFAENNELNEDEEYKNLKNDIINNPNDWNNWLNFAFKCYQIGKYRLALAVMHEDIVYSQSSLEKWKLLGLINNELESYSEAEYCFNEALSINPNDVDALSSLYRTYIFKSEYNKALEISEKLIAIKPDKVRFLRGKAEALYYLGNLKECQKIYQNIYSTKDNSLDIRNRIDEIKEMRNISKKNWYVTLILAIILPSFHRFYAGKWGTGILYIIIMIASLNFCKPICWALYFVDILFILSGFFKDKEGKYITIF